MSYINFGSTTKQNRVTQINNDLGTLATMNIYSGGFPANPDVAASGTLLATLTCNAAAFGTVAKGAGTPVISNAGSSFATGTFALAFSGGTGSGAVGTYTCAAGAVTGVAITNPGSYTAAPTVSFPSGGGAGAAATVPLTGVLTASVITQGTAVATGTAGYARFANSGGTAKMDVDVGTANASAIINTTSIVTGGPVSCSSFLVWEA